MNKFSKILMATLLLGNVLLITFFWVKTGLKSYIIISGIVTLGTLCFIFLVLKNGYMLSRRTVISKERNPKDFYANVGLLLLFYFLMLGFSLGLYLQETGILHHN